MTKAEFLNALKERLEGLPQDELRKSLDFYGEMLDDRIEDGMAETEAVASLGSMEEIVGQILAEIPLAKLVGHKLKSKTSLRGWEITLLVLGFPIWFPLLIAAAVLALSLLVVFWSVGLVAYAVDAALALSGVGFVLVSPVQMVLGSFGGGLVLLGGGLALAGLSILFFYVANWTFKGLVFISKWTMLGLKRSVIKKEKRK